MCGAILRAYKSAPKASASSVLSVPKRAPPGRFFVNAAARRFALRRARRKGRPGANCKAVTVLPQRVAEISQPALLAIALARKLRIRVRGGGAVSFGRSRAFASWWTIGFERSLLGRYPPMCGYILPSSLICRGENFPFLAPRSVFRDRGSGAEKAALSHARTSARAREPPPFQPTASGRCSRLHRTRNRCRNDPLPKGHR